VRAAGHDHVSFEHEDLRGPVDGRLRGAVETGCA
jgi:hypothetical protein